MGKAIVTGIEHSQGDLVCVMDADLSHPPELILDLLRALDGADGVIASRYAAGGTTAHWPRIRRAISWGATAFSRSLVRTACYDPLSGFFLFRRTSLAGLVVTGIGNKPLLEILAQKPFAIHEIPYEFRDRERGSSKLDPQGFVGFAHLLARLSWQSIRGTAPGLPQETEAPAEAHGP
jgi:dolichol-phosphate mannosyltransferase